MPKVKLTKSTIDALATPGKDIVVLGQWLSRIGVKVTPKGRKVFIATITEPAAQDRDCANTL